MKAAIFDMDGTLVKTLDFHLDAYLSVMKKHKYPPDRNFVRPRFGMTAEEIFREYGEEHQLQLNPGQLAKEKYAEFDLLCQNGVPLLPGVPQILDYLKSKGITLALASGSGRPNVDVALSATGLLQYFPINVAGDEVPRGKKFPDIWLEVARRLSLAPSDCLVFEDALYGVRSAKQAGMKVVAVASGYTTRERLADEEPDLLLNSLSEFKLELLKKPTSNTPPTAPKNAPDKA